ncbi:MAG: FIST C-terminal domain-containing protein [Polyangiaceae bacterium]|nr:FIST C-terminal domain-containing protein [Polyangiaceae bacterium]
MISAATSFIVHDDARLAGRDLADELLDALGGRPDLVLLFVSAKHDPGAALAGLSGRLGEGVRIAGGSSFAEICGDEGHTESVTAMGMRLGGARAETLSGVLDEGKSRGLGRRLGERARALDPALIVAFPDGLAVNASELLLGLQDALGASIPVVGGGAGDLGQFVQTYQIHDRDVITCGASIAVLSRPVRVATAARSGWSPVGATHRVTRAEGGVVLEIDGRPALELYEEYLGPRAEGMPAIGIEFPLGVLGEAGTPLEGEITMLRAVSGVDRERKALVLTGDLPQGAEVRMTSATKEDLLRGAGEAVAAALAEMPAPSAALVFDCMARKIVLGPRYREELRGALARLGAVPRAGFYTFGELSPADGVSVCHNETFTLALLQG